MSPDGRLGQANSIRHVLTPDATHAKVNPATRNRSTRHPTTKPSTNQPINGTTTDAQPAAQSNPCNAPLTGIPRRPTPHVSPFPQPALAVSAWRRLCAWAGARLRGIAAGVSAAGSPLFMPLARARHLWLLLAPAALAAAAWWDVRAQPAEHAADRAVRLSQT